MSPAPLPTSLPFPGPNGDGPTSMMAPDSRQPAGSIPEATLAALREALVRHVRQRDDVERLRPALQQFSRDARARALPPEEVLVHLKRVWSSIPLAEADVTAGDNTRALQRVVTVCIQEYFR